MPPKKSSPPPPTEGVQITVRLDPESEQNLRAVEAIVEAMLPPGPTRGRTSAAVRHALAVAAREAKEK